MCSQAPTTACSCLRCRPLPGPVSAAEWSWAESSRASAADPDQLASQIHLLYDGAMLAASLDGNAGVAAASRSAAEALLDSAHFHSAALPGPGSGRHRKQEQAVAAAGLHI